MKSDNNPESLNKALDLAVESGSSEESVEYFMATQLFTKDMNREISKHHMAQLVKKTEHKSQSN